ncbi:hypothetical protein DFH09DRAFT_1322447 [Mycena vulgaris]|nr:hypothetical protein DFH09DRAFT_1322447 [Mycena vulgaris]
MPRDVERAGGPAWQGASSGTRHRPVLTRGITNAVLHQDRHAGDLGIPSNHQATTPPPTSPTGSQQSHSTKPTPPPTSTALDNASHSPRPTPPTALNVINIINTTQLR